MTEFQITTKEPEKAKRLTHCDDSFSLLWDLEQEIKQYFKHGDGFEKPEEVLERVQNMIWDSHLLDLYE